MGGGDLNLKKSWHPTTMKNMERVWKAEQKHEAEQKKIEELQKELAEERTREEIRHFAEDQGVVKKKSERLDWMYEGVSALANKEEYLLGRAVDKTFEVIQQAESGLGNKPEEDALPESIFKPVIGNVTIDLANKIREDPLLMIKKQEDENRKKLLDNPIRMKQIADMLKGIHSKKKAKKEKKKSKKSRQRSKNNERVEDSDGSAHRRHPHKNGLHNSKYIHEERERPRKYNERSENLNRNRRSSDSSSERVSNSKRIRYDRVEHENYRDPGSKRAEERQHVILNRDNVRGHTQSRTRKQHSPSDSFDQLRDKGKRISKVEKTRGGSAFRNEMESSSKATRVRKQRSSSEGSSAHSDGSSPRKPYHGSNYDKQKHQTKIAHIRGSSDSRADRRTLQDNARARRRSFSSQSSSSDSGKRNKQKQSNNNRRETKMTYNHKDTSFRHCRRAKSQSSTSESSSSDSDESSRHKSSHKNADNKGKLQVQKAQIYGSLNSKSGKWNSLENERKRMQSCSSEDSDSDDENAKKKNEIKIAKRLERSTSRHKRQNSPKKMQGRGQSSSSESSSSDNFQQKKISKGFIPKQYGLIVRSSTTRIKRSPSQSIVKSTERAPNDSSPEAKLQKHKHDRDSKSNMSKKPTSSFRPEKASRKLNEAEKERRLKEMMEDAKLRDEQRSANLKQHLEEEKKEALLQIKTAGKDFITPILNKVADIGTVADRIKSNIYNIQRTKADLNKNFAKR